MRKWSSLAIVLSALVVAGSALADTPPDVYNDYAADGVLNCGHSRSALKGALNDASIHQYGDPWTFIGLKLAIRRQLAGGCRRGEPAPAFFGSDEGGTPSAVAAQPPPGPPNQKPAAGKKQPAPGSPQDSSPQSAGESSSDAAADVRQEGWMVLLGVLLLLVTLGSGGWAARRAFTE
jgi:hypothetical protein